MSHADHQPTQPTQPASRPQVADAPMTEEEENFRAHRPFIGVLCVDCRVMGLVEEFAVWSQAISPERPRRVWDRICPTCLRQRVETITPGVLSGALTRASMTGMPTSTCTSCRRRIASEHAVGFPPPESAYLFLPGGWDHVCPPCAVAILNDREATKA